MEPPDRPTRAPCISERRRKRSECRYEDTGEKADLWKYDSPDVHPFTRYGLDSDPTPPKQTENDAFKPRAFRNNAGFEGDRSNEIAPLLPRPISPATRGAGDIVALQ